MVSMLKKKVIPGLSANGFHGKHPHYRREFPDRIELLVFWTNPWGNSFSVDISTVFPSALSEEDKNYCVASIESGVELDLFSAYKRHRLKGMFEEGQWFYYTDVYSSPLYISPFQTGIFYNAISEKRALTYAPRDDEILVQKASDELYEIIADEVNHQLKFAYIWWENHNTPEKMKKHNSPYDR
jgi:hypothetical protein